MSFIPLHVYSGFSFLASGLSAKRIPLLAKKNGYKGVGICDILSLSGYAPFTHSAFNEGVTPFYLMDVEVLEGTFSLLTQSEEGYRNLCALLLKGSEESLTIQDIVAHQKGLSIILNPETTFLRHDYKNQQESELAKRLAYFLNDFAEVHFGIPYLPHEEDFVSFLRQFTKKYPYPTLAFPLIRYEKEDGAIVTSITKAINDHSSLSIKEEKGDSYFLTPNVIDSYYTEEEINATEEITASSSFRLIQKRGSLIHFENEEGLSSVDYLRKSALLGLAKKVKNYGETYQKRLDYELSIINEMGYADYFLVVADYVNFAKNHDILVGPGRGSGPASLVSYALNISTLDPVKEGLLFERFLNPERKSMPDIDVDFEDTKRDEVIRYLQKKYGYHRVSRVLATQNIGAKEALRDIGRTYGYEDRVISLIVSTIHQSNLSLRDDYRTSSEFRKLIDSDPYYLEIVSLASKIEGLPRQAGLHAAGAILNEEDIDKVLPCKNDENVGLVGCLEKDYLEEQGFLKMDLLGLTNLSTISRILREIKQKEGVDLSFEDIPYTEEESISLIKNGNVMGIFQMESEGMKEAIRKLEPTTFEDVAALEALFRPGPMEAIPTYARRKKGLEKVTYLDPDLEPILKSTYGIIVYQEQIMQIVQAVAGFSLGEADLFRRAISKKDAKKLIALKGKFIDGCLKKGKDLPLAERLFSLIERFANYGFNKSHAYSYAVITCKMAYLKKHYPLEFYCAILDSYQVGENKFLNAMSELKERGIHLECPSANGSGIHFQIDGNKVLLPLTSIKGLGLSFINELLDERTEKGPFLDLADFVSRTKKCGLSLSIFIKLVDAGLFDEFEPNRNALRASAYRYMKYAEMTSGVLGNQVLLDLGIEKPTLVDVSPSKKEDLDKEHETLGLMVSGSPLDFYKETLAKLKAVSLDKAKDSFSSFLTAGIIGNVKVIRNRKGKQMCFLDVYDDVTKLSFTLFEEAYSVSYRNLVEGNLVLIEGRKDFRRDGYLAYKVVTLGDEHE